MYPTRLRYQYPNFDAQKSKIKRQTKPNLQNNVSSECG